MSTRPSIARPLRIALVADALTRAALAAEANITHITPRNYRWALRLARPDFLLVESAWEGRGVCWKYKIASYPDVPKRSNILLQRMIACARGLGIPTVFWNKEDGVHFDRFIDSALLCEHILTVDANCIEAYRARGATSVHSMMFAVQPRLHHPIASVPTQASASFVGSYSHHVHDGRRVRQDMLFAACAEAGFGLTVYDRNSCRRSPNYRYPTGIDVRAAVPYEATADIYRDHLVSLNVNTVEDSPTMCSRRLLEIIASGGLCVTTPALSVAQHFAPYCHTVSTQAEAVELLARLKRDGHSGADRAMMAAGAACIAEQHSWAVRMQQITALI